MSKTMRAAQSLAMPPFRATVAPTPDHVRALEAALVSARAAEERFRGLVESIEAIPYISDRAKRRRSAAGVGR